MVSLFRGHVNTLGKEGRPGGVLPIREEHANECWCVRWVSGSASLRVLPHLFHEGLSTIEGGCVLSVNGASKASLTNRLSMRFARKNGESPKDPNGTGALA